MLRNLRGHASYAYNRIVSCISGDISQEVIKDPAVDEMWEAAKQDEGYQKVASLIEGKADVEKMKTLSYPLNINPSTSGRGWRGCH